MRVACFCGAVFDTDPPVGFCPHCDAPPAICASSATEVSELEAPYNEGLDAIRGLPEAA
jgi:DNA polymerase III gamma/tau subunit